MKKKALDETKTISNLAWWCISMNCTFDLSEALSDTKFYE